LACAVDKGTDYWCSIATWMPRGTIGHAFTRQAVPITYDFAEASPFSDIHCSWSDCVGWVEAFCSTEALAARQAGHAECCSATAQPLPDDSAQAVITDPPYYDAVPYAYLSDFFYVWLRRSIGTAQPAMLRDEEVPKDGEIVVDRPHELSNSTKDIAFYERELTKAFGECRRVLRSDGIAVIVFASKTTASWEAILQAVVDAGWRITGSWPIDTEREARIAALDQARLASSVHLVCRTRVGAQVGDWRDVLAELPQRMHEWMPRLASEGVVGADAIFACLGPALEIFSRHPRVEKASGDSVPLREYLEHVWAAVSREALSTIFRDADASGLEPDARLTAMWLWTLGHAKGKPDPANRIVSAVDVAHNGDAEEEAAEEGDEEEAGNGKPGKSNRVGFFLEFDAARKIAQGLGIHLEQSGSFVEVKGETARLLPVAERTKHLFGVEAAARPAAGKKGKKKANQPSLFAELNEADAAEGGRPELKGPSPGATVLDRLHQAMILFGAQRGELLKRFLVEEGVGKDARFWKLAQSLAALYPPGTDERRWVEGVLARKKGLGL
jgi:hypothetical protein